ncbi:hypothetical protein FBY35_3221 [Streptomyces sp. SLBN-118]|nr:hypothetical protein FBY35_3221 [Streptomyces sp. SLBN-118]
MIITILINFARILGKMQVGAGAGFYFRLVVPHRS